MFAVIWKISLFRKNSQILHLKTVFRKKLLVGKSLKMKIEIAILYKIQFPLFAHFWFAICSGIKCLIKVTIIFDWKTHAMSLFHLSNALIHTIFWEPNWCRIRCWMFSVEILRYFEVKGNTRELAAGRTVNLPPSAAWINCRFGGTVVTPPAIFPGLGVPGDIRTQDLQPVLCVINCELGSMHAWITTFLQVPTYIS